MSAGRSSSRESSGVEVESSDALRKCDGVLPRSAAEPVWWKMVGSELAGLSRRPLGLKWDRIGTAPAKGFESKHRAELKSSSK